jgi:hypothetical protein
MPSAILDAETLPRKDKDTPPGDQDVRVIEVESFFVLSVLLDSTVPTKQVKPDIEFRRFLSMITKEYIDWSKTAMYKGPGKSPALKAPTPPKN